MPNDAPVSSRGVLSLDSSVVFRAERLPRRLETASFTAVAPTLAHLVIPQSPNGIVSYTGSRSGDPEPFATSSWFRWR